ncbi:MAG TPA: helix-turn-helix transcriptional regulator [Solirubrobacterales bacterium]|nr:helix-turn-helix transcriptional regulator [Solirubrobacterales bacterium]
MRELGSRLARTRLERNVSQEQLAREAGVAKTTVERVESGREVRLTSLVRILRALGQLDALDRLIPEPLPSPLERVRLGGRRRQRARHSPNKDQRQGNVWRWHDLGSGAEDDTVAQAGEEKAPRSARPVEEEGSGDTR